MLTARDQSWLKWALSIYAVASLISMAVMSVGAGLLGLVLIFGGSGGPRAFGRALRAELAREFSRRYFQVSLGLAAACLLSLVVAELAPLGFGGNFARIHLLTDGLKLWYLFWPLLIVTGLRELADNERIFVLRAWIVAFGLLSVLGVIQHWIGWPRPQWIPGTLHRYHTTLFLGTHLTVASVLIFPFFASLDLLRAAWRRGPGESPLGIPWPGWFFLCGMGVWALIFTQSRTLWAALPVGLLVWVVLSLRRKWAVALSVIILLSVLVASQLPAVQLRFADKYGFSTREELWGANLVMLENRPVTGVGFLHNHELSGYYLMTRHPGASVFSGHAHNNLLDMLAGTGLLGAAAWVFWSGFVIVLAGKGRESPGSVARVPSFAAGLLCAWVVLQLNGLTQVNFWEAKVTHQMMWAVAWSLLFVSGRRNA